MLDTVPRGVQLSEVIEPLPVKPQGVYLLLLEDGSIQLNGEVRVCITSVLQSDTAYSSTPLVLEHLGESKSENTNKVER